MIDPQMEGTHPKLERTIQTTPGHPTDCICEVPNPMHRNGHTMNQQPTYLSHSALAHEIGINPNNIITIIRKWKHHPHNPTPKPDAWCTMPEAHNTPLWLTQRLPEWRQWKTRRDTIVAELQAQERANTAKKAWLESLT